MLFVFWICAFLVLYVYAGYPLLLASGLLGKRRVARIACIEPPVSVVIPAHNEEKVIRKKLLNLLSQNYPLEKMQILVGNDGSSDGTAAAVSEFLDFGVELVTGNSPRGKSSIQNAVVQRAHGEILVFTDADCLLPRNAMRSIVQYFTDPEVGLVTGCASFVNQGETSTIEGEGLYWKYERWLRKQESDRGLLAMASGSLFAMRSMLWRRLDPDVGDDFALPLQVAKAGFRNVMETRFSAATVLTQNQPQSMFQMKTRIISKDLRGLLRHSACLNPRRVGRVAVGLWSHKMLRWAIPYFLVALLVSNAFLAGQPFYAIALLAQLSFYVLAALGLLLSKKRMRIPLTAASSFCVVNLAALFGTLHCFAVPSDGHWKPVR
ncbi:MAG TPA: glycosyltransferase [Candidatus Sulfotelmatobacter sp.]|nr:glycosyltransferase [Candidatus Sulfotelmatobacter sp.]